MRSHNERESLAQRKALYLPASTVGKLEDVLYVPRRSGLLIVVRWLYGQLKLAIPGTTRKLNM